MQPGEPVASPCVPVPNSSHFCQDRVPATTTNAVSRESGSPKLRALEKKKRSLLYDLIKRAAKLFPPRILASGFVPSTRDVQCPPFSLPEGLLIQRANGMKGTLDQVSRQPLACCLPHGEEVLSLPRFLLPGSAFHFSTHEAGIFWLSQQQQSSGL